MNNYQTGDTKIKTRPNSSKVWLILGAICLLFIGYSSKVVIDSMTKDDVVLSNKNRHLENSAEDIKSSKHLSKRAKEELTYPQNIADKPRHLQFRNDGEFLAKLKEVVSLSSREQKAQIILEMLPYMNVENAKEVLYILGRAQDNGSPISTEIWDHMWKKFGEVDGETALNFLINDLRDDTNPVTVAQGMQSSNPQGLKKWLDDHKENAQHTTWVSAYIISLSDSAAEDINKATSAMLTKFSDPNIRIRSLEILSDQAILSGGSEGLKNYYQSLPDDARLLATETILKKLTSEDAASAVEWMQKKLLPPQSTLNEYPPYMLAALARQNSSKAIEWLCTQDSSKFTEQSNSQIHALVSTCLERDPKALIHYLQNNINNPQVKSVAKKIIEQFPYDPSSTTSEQLHQLMK